MTLLEAIRERHSVRQYTDKPIAADALAELTAELAAINAESGLNFQLVTEEPTAFSSFLAKYGKFRGVKNYIAVVGGNVEALEERAGYYGERLVLKAQILGLNTCWVVLTFGKRKSKKHFTVRSGEKLVCVIALGYGENFGKPHKNKPLSDVCNPAGAPDWFKAGVDAAMLAPTAMNHQKFYFELTADGKVKATAVRGVNTKLDLGIVKYHFEAGAGKHNFEWA